jgi:hypothetical protein
VGRAVDVRRIHPATSAELEDDDGQISEPRLAAYIAKYATKGTDETEATGTPIRSELDIARLEVSECRRRVKTVPVDTEHHPWIIQTCCGLGGLEQ